MQQLRTCTYPNLLSQPLDDKGNVEHDNEEDEVEEEEVDQQEVTPVQLRCVLEIINTGEDHGTPQPVKTQLACYTYVVCVSVQC